MPPIFYDSIIFGFLTIDFCAIAVFCVQFARFGKIILKPIPVAVFIFLLLSGGIVTYGSFIEPQIIVTTDYDLSIGAGTDIRIALISDFHAGPYKKDDFVQKAVSKINAQKPDIVLLDGDFVFGEEYHTEYLAPLKNLEAPLGKFAVFGSHDYGEGSMREINFNYESNPRISALEKALTEAGIKVLRNESVKISKDGKSFLLGGTDELWTGRADVEKTFADTGQNLRKILLAHCPDIVTKAVKYNIDVVLAAHTHGGQIRLPFWGAIPRIPDKLGQKYDQGLFDFNREDGGKTQLLITRGIGESGPRARLFAPPEIVLIQMQ